MVVEPHTTCTASPLMFLTLHLARQPFNRPRILLLREMTWWVHIFLLDWWSNLRICQFLCQDPVLHFNNLILSLKLTNPDFHPFYSLFTQTVLLFEHLFLLLKSFLEIFLYFVNVFRVKLLGLWYLLIFWVQTLVLKFKLFDLSLKILDDLWRQLGKISFPSVYWAVSEVFLILGLRIATWFYSFPQHRQRPFSIKAHSIFCIVLVLYSDVISFLVSLRGIKTIFHGRQSLISSFRIPQLGNLKLQLLNFIL